MFCLKMPELYLHTECSEIMNRRCNSIEDRTKVLGIVNFCVKFVISIAAEGAVVGENSSSDRLVMDLCGNLMHGIPYFAGI